ncbi:MAG: 4-hydroxythreonine-4-phosphate dehydrogenase PdxA [bacterium]
MLANTLRPVAVSVGEPAGIGPELLIKYIQKEHRSMVAFCDPDLLQAISHQQGMKLSLLEPDQLNTTEKGFQKAGELGVVPVSFKSKVTAGQLNVENAATVVEALARACDACLANEYAGLMTAPLHKGIINQAGIPFTGHTEFLADRSGVDQVVMMLASPKLRVALLTTHLPLRDVADQLTHTRLKTVLAIINTGLQQLLGHKPVIHVLGLNPHAGEGGYLGMEEIEIIEPVIEQYRQQGMHVEGPFPADTAFNPEALKKADVFLSMFHDQGLPVLKFSGFGESINMTLGLPFLRVSVDHGTALDLAGKGIANSGSFEAAMACFDKVK